MKKKPTCIFHGQIAVLLAIALVALLGFTALAVDGAMIFSDKRNAQNAADAAALAGAGMAAQYLENHAVMYDNFSCTKPDVIDAMNTGINKSIERAQTNQFTIDNDIMDNNGVEATCLVQNIGPFIEQFLFIQVKITSPTKTSFAQLFYSEPVQSTVESIARVRPRTNLGFGYAVASIGDDCSEGGIVGVGHVDVQTTHGGLFSNSCMIFSGNVDVHVDDPLGTGIYYYSTLTNVGSTSINPAPLQSPVQISPYIVPQPECSILPSFGEVTIGGNTIQTLNPGQYSSLTITGTAQVTLNPGLYCLSGDLLLTANQTLTGNEVTLYFIDGEFKSTANSIINLSAPTVDNPPAIPGMLITASLQNDGVFTITGNSDSTYQGTVYIPNGTIDSIGNSSMMGLKSQFVSKKVTLSGNTDINIEFEGAYNYQIPASVDLLK